MKNPYQVVRDLEESVCEYTGAPYCVAVNSCTMAVLLAVAWNLYGKDGGVRANCWREDCEPIVEIPKRTYVSVPMAIIHAGGRPTFRDEEWLGGYQLAPLPVWDCARMFTSGMYPPVFPVIPAGYVGRMMCLSFHSSKILGDTQGGAILHDDPEADVWLRRARFDGRSTDLEPKDDKDIIVGWHAYISPDVCTRLLWKLRSLPKHNEPLPNDQYADLSALECFT